jgi:hypothetical protein
MTHWLQGWLLIIVALVLAAAVFGCADRPHPTPLTFCDAGIVCVPV